MDSETINKMAIILGDHIPAANLFTLRQMLADTQADEHDLTTASMQFKDPTVALVLSILLGGVGADRFFVGDIGLGVVKLLTCGGLGIWWLIDIFLIMDITKRYNWNLLCNFLNNCQRGAGDQPDGDYEETF
ncbi:MAG: TM2 domain-containing protein [Bacteroidales bacterium]|nr:TM2 domain-containing protein [Bacteroidales bacterium]MDY5321061.1 TM2 domain-containing protein [Prevotella sp.]